VELLLPLNPRSLPSAPAVWLLTLLPLDPLPVLTEGTEPLLIGAVFTGAPSCEL
jgi:hypothetical protein